VKLGIITGSGTHAVPGLDAGPARPVETRFGPATLSEGLLAGVHVAHVSRHGDGHVRLSSQVNHRANVVALREAGVDAVLAVTVCGAVDAELALGSLIAFDDLHFPTNRLADGALCTLHTEPGAPDRGHWVFDSPFSGPLRQALVAGAQAAELEVREGGCYGHVDGPRFNTRSEIAMLAAAGVTAVSQTAGPETVLCGEAELPFALLGYVTDYANGVREQATPTDELLRQVEASTDAFAATLSAALPRLAPTVVEPTGSQIRFGE
jgi:purine nucleoside phosphorylase